MSQFSFSNSGIEALFLSAEKLLFNKSNLIPIKYDNFDVSTFDKLNKSLLQTISKKPIVYCIWVKANSNEYKAMYIGHAKETISRQRIRCHLTKKNKRTGAKLDNVKECLSRKETIALSYLIIEPSYMRKPLEEWLIIKNKEQLVWNRNI